MPTVFSKNFYASGTFNGLDQVPLIVNPWESVSINIVCVDIVVFQGSAYVNYCLAGNNFSPDIMRYYNLDNPIPDGLSFPFPAAPNTINHIDCHISGTNTQAFQFYYTVYYTKNSV